MKPTNWGDQPQGEALPVTDLIAIHQGDKAMTTSHKIAEVFGKRRNSLTGLPLVFISRTPSKEVTA